VTSKGLSRWPAHAARRHAICPGGGRFATHATHPRAEYEPISWALLLARPSLRQQAGNSVGLLPRILSLVPTDSATASGRRSRGILRPPPAAGAEAGIMGSRLKPWSKAQVRRVLDAIHSGGCVAYRSRRGWSVWLSGDGAGPSRRRFFIPERSLSSRHPRWLGNLLTAAYRQALDNLEGVQLISGSEARNLVRWCTRWSRSPRPPLTAEQRARIAACGRWLKRVWRVPETVQSGGYVAERSRRAPNPAACGATTWSRSGPFAPMAGTGMACRSSRR
jgi:hypothetical protein